MNDLPWLVSHWRVLLLVAPALPVLGAALGLVVALASTLARHASVRRALGGVRGHSLRDDGVRVTLVGRIAAGGRATTVAAPSQASEASTSVASSDLALEVGGERVALLGSPRVLVGTYERGPLRLGALPQGMRARLVRGSAALEALARQDATVVARSVAAGDRVIASGVSRRIPSADAAHDYRRPAGSWALVVDPSDGGQGIAAAALPPFSERTARAVSKGAIVGLALALIPAGAVFPLRQHAQMLAFELRARPHHDPALVEREVALDELLGDVVAKQDALLRHRQLRRAAADGSSHPSRSTSIGAAIALAELGEMEAASERLALVRDDEGDVADAIVYLLGGRADLAARTLRHAGRKLPTDEPGIEPLRMPRRELHVVADALDARFGGDRDAFERVRRQAMADPLDRTSHFLLADLLDGDARAEVLRRYPTHGPPEAAAMSLERVLAREIGDRSGRDWERLVYPVWLAFGREEGHLWEFFPALFERPETLAREPQTRIEAAYAASAIGDHARATALDPLGAGEVLASRTSGARYVDVYSAAGVQSVLRQVIAARGAAADPLPGAHGVWLARPLSDWLERSDASSLASVLDASPADADQAYLVADRARGWKRGAGEVSAWLRSGVFEHRSRSRLGRLAELENLRLLAAAIDDQAAADDLGAIVARHRKALTRRELLVPLAILEEIVMQRHAAPDIAR